MAFHYQNLLLKFEIDYPQFEQQYVLLKNVATKTLYGYGTRRIYKYQDSLKKLDIAKRFILTPTIKLSFNRVEKLLLIINIVFADNVSFLKTLIKTF